MHGVKPKRRIENLEISFDLFSIIWGVANLLDVEDMSLELIDDFSVMLYVCELYFHLKRLPRWLERRLLATNRETKDKQEENDCIDDLNHSREE